jgi:hypothetical protein
MARLPPSTSEVMPLLPNKGQRSFAFFPRTSMKVFECECGARKVV